MSLAAAIAHYRAEGGDAHRYDSYREQAQRDGHVRIGRTNVPATKVGGKWTVETAVFLAASSAAATRDRTYRDARERAVRQATDDYAARVLHPGGWVSTSWGGYSLSGGFHCVGRTGSESHCWLCNSCWQAALTEHEGEECHRCRDWSPCGTDCTLSRVYCESCGTSQPLA
jgi:hypothetical protein